MIKLPTPGFIRNMSVSHMVWLIAIVGVMSSRLSNVTPEETIEGDDVASHE